MTHNETTIAHYIQYCAAQKQLDPKTLKAYRIDLRQFQVFLKDCPIEQTTSFILENYIEMLHKTYRPKTVKRKIASVKAMFHFFEYRGLIQSNPFRKIQIHIRYPFELPKTIPIYIVETLLSSVYLQSKTAHTPYQRKNALRDAAIMEFLFATGVRVSELCTLSPRDIDLYEGIVLIHGKGNKERRIIIGAKSVIETLQGYQDHFHQEMDLCNHFFVNQSGNPVTDQAVRRIIKKYSSLASIDFHITPHMFRHTFATSLLEADVDIRYIQEMLGHSSINITEIYTHVAMAKQKDILTSKHPRINMHIK